MAYRVVGIDDPNVYQQPSSGVQVLSSPGVNVNGQYYLIGSQNVLGEVSMTFLSELWHDGFETAGINLDESFLQGALLLLDHKLLTHEPSVE